MCECVDHKILLLWMLISKRFYLKFIPAVFRPVCIFTRRGLKIMENSAYVQVFSATRLEWDRVRVREIHSAVGYFKGKRQDYPTHSKLVQVSHNQIILVGGSQSRPSLLTYEYDVARSCLLIDLSSGIVSEMSQMTHGRYYHGVANIGKYVYAVAGKNDWSAVRTCERYDISADKWTQLPENSAFDEFA